MDANALYQNLSVMVGGNKMIMKELREILELCWENGESKGQCYVTALIVQDFYGGKILRFKTSKMKESHYWNVLPDGTGIDLTSDQYGGDGINPIFSGGYPSSREEKLYPYPMTIRRYSKLMRKVASKVRGKK